LCIYCEARSSNAITFTIIDNFQKSASNIQQTWPTTSTSATRLPRSRCVLSCSTSWSSTDSYSKNAKGLHLLTMNTPNGQAVQVLLEELKDVYGTEWTTTLVDIMTNDQKKEWFLRLDPNGKLDCYLPLCGTSLTLHRPYSSPGRQHSEPSVHSHGDLGRDAV
jgi:hypothetical protein